VRAYHLPNIIIIKIATEYKPNSHFEKMEKAKRVDKTSITKRKQNKKKIHKV
jgi:hypothetical protein